MFFWRVKGATRTPGKIMAEWAGAVFGRFCTKSHSGSLICKLSLAVPWLPWPSKKHWKTNGFLTFSLFSPTKPEHVCIMVAISCHEAHFSSFCSFSGRFSTKNHPGSLGCKLSLAYSWLPWPSKKHWKTNGFLTFSLFGPTKPEHICIMLAISCLEAHLLSFCSFLNRFSTKNLSFSLHCSFGWGVRAALGPAKKGL